MSAATPVPETGRRDAGDVREQLRKTGTGRLFRDAAVRLGAADGTSFARAIGHSSLLTLIPALIAVIGLVVTFDLTGFQNVLEDAALSFAPGPAGRILTDALERAEPSSGPSALLAGLAGMLISGTVGVTHLERAANRIYGVDEDRAPWRRLGLAVILAATVEVMFMVALAVIVAGGSIGDGGDGATSDGSPWSVLRWPVGVALVTAATTVIFKVVPARRQPGSSWLVSGTAVSVTIWVLATVVLGLVYERASVLGGSYGPLVGIIALLVWAYATGLAVLYGLAFAAQLEAGRAGISKPARDP